MRSDSFGVRSVRITSCFGCAVRNRLTAEAEGSLLDTYRLLRTQNPSPYMFYISSDSIEIAGSSPETLVKLQNGVLHTFPLAGTRPRGKTEAEDKALEESLLAAERGDPKAQCAFGFCCLKHYGGAEGKAEADKWFAKAIDGLREAAENGDPEAQTLLSECYGEGNGVRQDRTLSRIWLRKAAEQDYASAQLELAILLFVEDKDMKEADKWFRKAAENGESAAEGFMKRHFPDPEGE